ncbi:hypothetical protein MTR_2g022230 [Medicago truncatula]|uniref:Uncharacterized protein n=1 Tax=Medicago truncatula TaxID=3880 RepID=A0A072V415_MEDTR|nr:hypothetical protein MTR_2g022230 [Medicago truncatula]
MVVVKYKQNDGGARNSFRRQRRSQISPSSHRQTGRGTLVVRRVKLVAPPSINTTSEQISFGFGWNLSKRIEQTPRQNAKSNAAQDDEQHNAALRRRNHRKHKRKNLVDVKTTYLDRKKRGKKDVEG